MRKKRHIETPCLLYGGEVQFSIVDKYGCTVSGDLILNDCVFKDNGLDEVHEILESYGDLNH